MRSPSRVPAALALLGSALVAITMTGAMPDLAAVLWCAAVVAFVAGAVLAARVSQRPPRARGAAHLARSSRGSTALLPSRGAGGGRRRWGDARSR